MKNARVKRKKADTSTLSRPRRAPLAPYLKRALDLEEEARAAAPRPRRLREASTPVPAESRIVYRESGLCLR